MALSSSSSNIPTSSSAQMQSQDVAIRFPPKTIVGATIKSQREVVLETNFYKLKIKHNQSMFYARKHNGKVVNLAEGLSNDASTELRRSCLVALFKQLVTTKQEVFGPTFKSLVYDLGETLLTIERLILEDADRMIFSLNDTSLNEDQKAYIPNCEELYCECKYVNTVSIDEALLKTEDANLATATNRNERSMLSYIELILSQEMILNTKEFHVFKHSNFLREVPDTTGGSKKITAYKGKDFKDGVAKSVLLCYNSPTQSQLTMQLAGKSGAFFPAIELMKYLEDFLGTRDLVRSLRGRDERKKTVKEIMNLTLITTHLKQNRIFMCKGLSDKDFDQIFFEQRIQAEDGSSVKKKKISCMAYFEERYNRNATRGLPALIDRVRRADGSKMENYYPMNVCKILSGQRYPHQKMSADFQMTMTKATQKAPSELKTSVENVNKAGFLTQVNLYARKFNLDIDQKPISVNAEQLYEPSIVWKDFVAETNIWRNLPPNRKFLVNGHCSRFVFTNYRNAVKKEDAS
ncbi:PAZ domain protein [Aphelenchoides besseyi]|nr:PAZ domain protein [Aphelenchoides besseyi]